LRARKVLATGVGLGLAACVDAEPPGAPPRTPALADTPWPIAHQSAWAQASSDLPVVHPDEGVTVERLATDYVSITHAYAPPHGDGRQVVWASSPTAVRKIARDGDLAVLAEAPREGGLGNLLSGAYTFVDADGRFFVAEADRIVRFDDDRGDAASPITRGAEWVLTDRLPDEDIVALGLTAAGEVVWATSLGRVGLATRDLVPLDTLQLDGAARVSNSLATDDRGGVYIVTESAMHRCVAREGTLSTNEADGAWSAPYRTTTDPAPGRLGIGSGSTPTLMGPQDDPNARLVVITDGQPLMHLVAFWAGDIPEDWQGLAPDRDRRIAAEVPITFGDPTRTRSISEQSVLVSGWSMLVVNNDYGPDAAPGMAPVLAGDAPLGVEQHTWDPARRALTRTWVRTDRSCPNGIPAMSRPSGVALCVGRRGPTWTVEALDWATGADAWHVPLGDDNGVNSVYAAIEVGADGEIVSGTLEGMVRVRRAE
jgi:hypothetical protein